MATDYTVRTLRLKIYPFGENKKEIKKRVYQISNDAWRAANWISGGQYLNDLLVRRVYARKKINPKENLEQVAEVEQELIAMFGTKRQATTERDIKEAFPNIPPCITNPLNQVVVSSYNKEKANMLSGTRSLRSYKQGMPFTTTKTSILFFEDKDKHGVKWKLGRDEHLCFYITYGRDKGNYKDTIQKILDGELECAAPQIQIKKGNFYLLLPVKDVKQEFRLDPELSVGADLGVAVPAYVALSKGKPRQAIGSIDDFLRVRMQFQKRRRNLQRSIKQTSGGHGRVKKLNALNRLADKERNFAKTYNHMVSRNIVNFALKNKAGVIKLELLEGFGKEEKHAFILRNWSYFELQNYITYKAKNAGITVVKVDPYHTSQTCSECGNYEPEQRDGRSFKCKKCGASLNADHNAAVNIARSEKIVSKKEQCEFYKKAA